MTDDPAIVALLAEARVQYASGLLARASELESLVGRGAWDEARRAAHKLRGSSGTYGFAEVSTAAAAVEEALLDAGGPPAGAVEARVVELVRAVVEQAGRAASGGVPAQP